MQPRRVRRGGLQHPWLSACNERHFAWGWCAGSAPGRVWQRGEYSCGQDRGDVGLAKPGQEREPGEKKDAGEVPPPQELEGLLCWAAWRGEMVMAGRDPAAPCTGLAGFPNSRSGGGCVLGGPWQPLQSQDSLSYRRGAGERESSSYGGQAAEGTCCAHGSS